MTDLQRMEALQDAAVILVKTRTSIATGTNAVWKILDRANKHINDEMKSLLTEAKEEK